MPDMESAEYHVIRLANRRLAHVYKLFRIVFTAHSRLEQLNFVKLNQDAVELFSVPLDGFLKRLVRGGARNDVHVRTLPLTESAKAFDLGVCLETRETGPDIHVAPNIKTSPHPIQNLVPHPRERQEPRLAVVQAERRAGEWNADERILGLVS